MIVVGTREVRSEVRGAPPLVEVSFTIPSRSDIVTAALVGEFNEWSPTTTMMTATDEGFTARLWLQRGRRYRFRYLLNGERWENDWAADDYESNEHGGDDSVIDLRDDQHRGTGGVAAANERRGAPSGESESGRDPFGASAMFDRDRRSLADLVRRPLPRRPSEMDARVQRTVELLGLA